MRVQQTAKKYILLREIVAGGKAKKAVADGANGLLHGLLERARNAHDLTDRLHLGADAGGHAVELAQVPARDLDHAVVQAAENGRAKGRKGYGYERQLQTNGKPTRPTSISLPTRSEDLKAGTRSCAAARRCWSLGPVCSTVRAAHRKAKNQHNAQTRQHNAQTQDPHTEKQLGNATPTLTNRTYLGSKQAQVDWVTLFLTSVRGMPRASLAATKARG